MKNLLYLISIALIALFILGCDKDDDNNNNQDQDKYTVKCAIDITGEHSNLNLVYYDHNKVKKEVNNPTLPWSKTLADFLKGDSVYYAYSVKGLAGDTFILDARIEVLKDEGIIDYGESNEEFIPLFSDTTFTWSWSWKIN